MKNSKLIIVTGMSGSGKSTTSQRIAKQLELNGIKNYWLHEEIENHPIREQEFSVASKDSEEGMDQNVQFMYELWYNLAEKIKQSDCVYVMEGCYYQNIIRYFLKVNYPKEKVLQFYKKIMGILEPLHPTIIFLYRQDIKQSFAEAFEIRGTRWKNLILDPEGEGYFKTHEYKGDESIYKMWEEYQTLSHLAFEQLKSYKLKLNTQDKLWGHYLKEIMRYLELSYIDETDEKRVINPLQYCGRYVMNEDGNEKIIEIKLVDEDLYCQVWFWSNMKLYYLGNDLFQVQSFPIKLQFTFKEDKPILLVKGTYGWDLTGKILIRD